MTITEPGVYDIPADAYHADPCPTASLSASGAHTITWECPAAYDYERQNRTNKRVFDIGTSAHLMMLEPDLYADHVVIVRGVTKDGKTSDGYSSQDAKDQRDAAYAAGKTPLLPKEDDMVRAMRAALLSDPIGRNAFRGGKAERSIFWRDPEFGIWCRTRPDWWPDHGRYLTNYKTAASANPDDVARAIFNLGYFQKSAWELDGVEAVTGERPSKFCLLVQSKTAPYLVIPVWLHPEDMGWGQKLNRFARGTFAWCQANNQWPGFSQVPGEPPRAFDSIRMPGWAIKHLEEKDKVGAFEVPTIMENAA